MWEKDCQLFRREQGLTPKQALLLKSTAEHLKARQDGGRDSCSNIAAACLYCNRKRHAGRSKCAPDSASYKRVIQEKVSKGKWHPLAATLKLQLMGNQQENPEWRH
ncbi:HNH endonuclease [Curvibacter sp. AEP1-3]|uniref:HNH endonuclease n=1 Tax=Curvibacter sp. AEP1-3 TaxID=1844971 RepID=UPI000B3C0EE6